jgi:hypothetical protein
LLLGGLDFLNVAKDALPRVLNLLASASLPEIGVGEDQQRENRVVEGHHRASFLPQLAHEVDRVHPAGLGWGEPCPQAFNNLR